MFKKDFRVEKNKKGKLCEKWKAKIVKWKPTAAQEAEAGGLGFKDCVGYRYFKAILGDFVTADLKMKKQKRRLRM